MDDATPPRARPAAESGTGYVAPGFHSAPLTLYHPPMPDRAALVAAAAQAWTADLLDLSRRNNLLYHRDSQANLPLDEVDAEELAALLDGEALALGRLLRAKDGANERRVRKLAEAALSNLEEKGLDTLHVGLGLATWQDDGAGRAPAAPAVLLPVSLGRRPGGPLDWVVGATGDLQVNPALLLVLQRQFRLDLDPAQLLPPAEGEGGPSAQLAEAFERLAAAAACVPGFALARDKRVMANFTFHKLALVRDLEESADLCDSELVAALAGDPLLRQQLGRAEAGAEVRDTVLDADASQRGVLAFGGRSLVVQGPPGTGKSQTIANLIAELAAQGKRVLFVAEKRAALEAVAKRLEDPQVGLGRLFLDLHGAELTRRQVLERVRERLAELSATPRAAAAADWAGRDASAAKLDAHMRAEADGRYAARLRLMENGAADVGVRVGAPALAAALAGRAGFVTGLGAVAPDLLAGGHPWSGAKVPQARVAEVAGWVDELAQAPWMQLAQEAQAWGAGCGLPALADPAAFLAWAEWMERALACAERCGAGLFDQDLAPLVAGLARADDGFWSVVGGTMFDRDFRAARAAMRAAAPALRRSAAEELADARAALALQQAAPGGARPSALRPCPPALRAQVRNLADRLAALGALLPDPPTAAQPWAELAQAFAELAAAKWRLSEVPPVHALETALAAAGLGAFIPACRAAGLPVAAWPAALERVLDRSLLEDAALRDPAALGFRAEAHEGTLAAFAAADRAALDWRRAEVRRLHAAAAVAAMNRHPEQEALLRREAAKKARHLPLRKLMAEAGEVLCALCPCVMASPLTVSQLLPARRGFFDAVIFDEASQVRPADAVPSLYRAQAMVVAGDSRQMPPTNFFVTGEEEDGEGEPGATAGFESLLDSAVAFLPERTLAWHYRSRDDRLIAFSNAQLYGSRLLTFPGPRAASPLSFVQVAADGEGGGETSAAEVARVVELVLAHAAERPRESLGVIAFGLAHAARLQQALDAALAAALPGRPELAAFFDPERAERFFIKNLERVQGDERDAVILSVGYGRDASGGLPHRFGPLNQQGGERRLNVAVTRAKRRMTVVASFAPHELDPARCSADGARLLRDYLAHAAAVGAAAPAAAAASDVLEERILGFLRGRGVAAATGLGTSAQRLAIALPHPHEAGAWALAVETDGPAYAGLPAARDRDRLRPQVLGGLGWRCHRVWAAEWQRDPAAAGARLWAAYEAALRPPPAPAPAPATPAPAAAPTVVSGAVRGRLPVTPGLPIGDYSDAQLRALLAWVRQDAGHLSDEELMERMVAALGYARRGPRIAARLREILSRQG